jgi:hypothetical protein
MPNIGFTPPPGVKRKGTLLAVKGAWYDTKWVRWYEGVLQAIGGFQSFDVSGTQVDMAEPVRGTHAWRNNAGDYKFAYGGPTKIKVLSAAGETVITPSSGFTAGDADASKIGGPYNSAATNYGEGPYGTGDSLAVLTEAQTYQMDNYGEDLVFVAYSDGKLWYHDTSAATPAAVITPSAGTVPTSNAGVVVTPENFLMLLGANGLARRVFWADQDDYTDWDYTSVTNQAGYFDLPGQGIILAGRRSQNETLVWTDVDLFSIRYVGGTFIYTATPVGAVGAISRRSMAVVGSVAYWMGPRGFYVYNGYTESIPCDVADYVFEDMNPVQLSKIWAEVRQEFGEVTWHYCSSGSDECDRSVTYNFKEGFWYINTVERTGGVDRGIVPNPLAFDADGLLWEHEIGTSHGSDTPEATTGPIELGRGDNVMHLKEWIPDEATLGDLEMYVEVSMYPTEVASASEVEYGPYTPANPTNLRLVARQARIRVVEDQPGWRLGELRLEVEPGGRR